MGKDRRTRELEQEKAQVEEELRKKTIELSQQFGRLAASIRGLSWGFIMIDEREKIITLNPAAQALLGLKNKNELAITLSDIQKKLAGSLDLRVRYQKCLQEKRAIEIKNISFGNKFLRILFNPIIALEQVLGVVLIIEDITEAKLLERAKDEFFAVASHELRTPLSAIRGNMAMVQEFYAKQLRNNKDLREMIQDTKEASIRLIKIVNDFLNLSRLEQQRVKFKTERFDLAKSIHQILEQLTSLARSKNLYLKFQPGRALFPQVMADPERTQEVITNLVSNALNYTPHGGVTVAIEKGNGFLKVRVTDTGQGILPQNQKLLFHKFQQAGEKILARNVSSGTGLGLYISKLLVEAMGGRIALEKSIPGKGSTFNFTLPLAPQSGQSI